MATKRILRSIRLDKIAAVDQPCQEHATVAIIKRAPAAGAPPAIVKATFQEALRAELLDEAVCEAFWEAFENQWAIQEAFKDALTDELSAGGDGSAATAGFTDAMKTIATAAAQAARTAASTAPEDLQTAVEDAVEKWLRTQHKENPMKIISKAALVSAVASFAIAKSTAADMAAITDAAVEFDALDTLSGQPELLSVATAKASAKKSDALAREVAVLKLAPAARAHFDALSADAQTAFLAKSAEDQAAEIEAAQGANPVVYKCKDGTEIRKSDGAAVLALAKRNDELEAKVADLTSGSAATAIEKRARTEFPNVALATATSMLKSAAQVGETSEAGADIIKSLTAMNRANGGVFKSLGTTDVPLSGDQSSIQKARTDFEAEVTKAASERKIPRSEAMSKVRTERPDLFAAAYPESAETEVDA